MMHTEQRILLVSKASERITRLSCIFEFLGEDFEIIPPETLTSHLAHTRFRAVVLSLAFIEMEQAKSLAAQYPWQPFLILGEPHSVLAANIIGRIDEPFNYPQLTELLHFCQVFGQAKRADIPTSGNQTKLFRSLVGRSQGIANVRHLISQVASSDATVLVLGQSGTGKEVVARNIHYLSSRREGPFIPVNCGAIPLSYWKVSCLVMKKVHLQEPLVLVKAVLNWLRVALYFWMKLAICHCRCR